MSYNAWDSPAQGRATLPEKLTTLSWRSTLWPPAKFSSWQGSRIVVGGWETQKLANWQVFPPSILLVADRIWGVHVPRYHFLPFPFSSPKWCQYEESRADSTCRCRGEEMIYLNMREKTHRPCTCEHVSTLPLHLNVAKLHLCSSRSQPWDKDLSVGKFICQVILTSRNEGGAISGKGGGKVYIRVCYSGRSWSQKLSSARAFW